MSRDRNAGWIGRVVFLFFALLLANVILAFVLLTNNNPHGNWDAWAIWNMHARFLYRGGSHWTALFSPELAYSHPDYPLLLPGLVAGGWFFLGSEHWLVPAAIAFFFEIAVVGLLVSAVGFVRGTVQALLAGCVLLATSAFILQGPMQYADIPLAFFYLAALAALILHDSREDNSVFLLALSGLAAGLGLSTKNEGWAFAAALFFTRILFRKETIPWLIGLLFPALITLYFKVRLAPSNDLLSAATPAHLWQCAMDISRYRQIVATLFQDTIYPGAVFSAPVLIIYFLLVGKNSLDRKNSGAVTPLWGALGLTLTAYLISFLFTPYPLAWHLSTSLDRLLMQLWPSVLLLYFITVERP